MKIDHLARAIAAAALFVCASTAEAGVLVPVPEVPGSMNTHIWSVNDNGVLTGDYTDQNFNVHGLVGTLDGKYTFFDYRKDTDTQGTYINNDGQVVGLAIQRQLPGLDFQFVRTSDGVTTAITIEGRKLRGGGTAGSLTDSGLLVGNLEKLRRDGQFSRSRSYSGQGTNYTAEIVLPFKGVTDTWAAAVNSRGDVVGHFDPCGCSRAHGFLIKDGTATQIDYPDANAVSTELSSINDNGLVIGSFTNDQDSQFPFLFDSATGKFERLPVDWAATISSAGLIAAEVAGQPYVYCLTKKNCPKGTGAVERNDHWVNGSAESLQAVLCRHRCLRIQ